MIEICIDSLESAHNAIKGGADELEICSSLIEGGLSPSPGLVMEVSKLVKDQSHKSKPKVNVMLRCRGGSDFCYTDQEMATMLADIEIYKSFCIHRFVFGALTYDREIDKINCTKIVNKAHPIPVTFHRAFDLCKEPKRAIEEIIELGFTRLLTSGQESSADTDKANELFEFLLEKFSDRIQIMPGAGICCDNAYIFIKMGFSIIHSSCKIIRHLPSTGKLCMGSDVMYVTDEAMVRKLKDIITR